MNNSEQFSFRQTFFCLIHRYFFSFLGRRVVYFLTFFLCVQNVSSGLLANPALPRQTIEDFAVEKTVDQLFLLMQKRLAIMHEVARTKWNHNLPIEDLAREQQILMTLVEQARRYDLDDKWIVKFFQAQIDAAKEIQKNDIALWQEQGVVKFDAVLDLKIDLRDYIDRINQEMLELLSKIYKKNDKNIESKFILAHPISIRTSDSIEDPIWRLAISPFTP